MRIYKPYFARQLEWIIGFLFLGIIGVMVYLLITGAFLSVPIPFLSGWTETTKYNLFQYSMNTYYETCELAYNMEDYYNSTHLYDFALNSIYGNTTGGEFGTGLSDTDGYFGRALENSFTNRGQIKYEDLDISGMSFTIMAWIYPTTWGSQNYITAVTGVTNRFFVTSGNLSLISFNVVYSNTTINLNEWVHVAGVYDVLASELRLYQNATLVGIYSGASASNKWDGEAVIFRRGDGDNLRDWYGKIDEFRIYKGEARTQSEIQQDMNTPMQLQLNINGLEDGDITQLWYNSTHLFEQQDASGGQTLYNIWNFSGGIDPYSGMVNVFHEEMTYNSPVIQFYYGDVYTYSVGQRITLNDIGLFMFLIIVFGIPFIAIPVIIIIRKTT